MRWMTYEMAGSGPGRHRSSTPRHGMPHDSGNEGLKRMSGVDDAAGSVCVTLPWLRGRWCAPGRPTT